MLSAGELHEPLLTLEGRHQKDTEWWPLRTSSFPLVLALPFLLKVHDGDALPGLSAGMSDLFQLL